MTHKCLPSSFIRAFGLSIVLVCYRRAIARRRIPEIWRGGVSDAVLLTEIGSFS
jgi:hypothetical protein